MIDGDRNEIYNTQKQNRQSGEADRLTEPERYTKITKHTP